MSHLCFLVFFVCVFSPFVFDSRADVFLFWISPCAGPHDSFSTGIPSPPPPSSLSLSLSLSLSSDSHCWFVSVCGGTKKPTEGRNEAGTEALEGSDADDPLSPPLALTVGVGVWGRGCGLPRCCRGWIRWLTPTGR